MTHLLLIGDAGITQREAVNALVEVAVDLQVDTGHQSDSTPHQVRQGEDDPAVNHPVADQPPQLCLLLTR